MRKSELSPEWLRIYSVRVEEAIEEKDTELVGRLLLIVRDRIKPYENAGYHWSKGDEVLFICATSNHPGPNDLIH